MEGTEAASLQKEGVSHWGILCPSDGLSRAGEGGVLPQHHLESTALGIWGCRCGPGEWDESHQEHAGGMQTVSVWPWAQVCPGTASWKSGLRGP